MPRHKKDTFSPTAQISFSLLALLSLHLLFPEEEEQLIGWSLLLVGPPFLSGQDHCRKGDEDPHYLSSVILPQLFGFMDLESVLQSLSFSLHPPASPSFPLFFFFPDIPELTVPTFHICKGSRKLQFSLRPKMGFPSQNTSNSFVKEFKKCLFSFINQCLISLLWLVALNKYIISQKAEGPGIAGI